MTPQMKKLIESPSSPIPKPTNISQFFDRPRLTQKTVEEQTFEARMAEQTGESVIDDDANGHKSTLLDKIKVSETKNQIAREFQQERLKQEKLEEQKEIEVIDKLIEEEKEKLEKKEALKRKNQEAKDAKQFSKEVSVDKQRSLTLAIIGPPNAGKSTFMNYIANDKVCDIIELILRMINLIYHHKIDCCHFFKSSNNEITDCRCCYSQ